MLSHRRWRRRKLHGRWRRRLGGWLWRWEDRDARWARLWCVVQGRALLCYAEMFSSVEGDASPSADKGIHGSVPESIISALYTNAYKALKPGGRLLVHDFMVNDSLDSPALGALWALQHVTVNADGLGLAPFEIIARMSAA